MANTVYGVSLGAHMPFVDDEMDSRSHRGACRSVSPPHADRDRPAGVSVNIVLFQQDTGAMESNVFLCPTVNQYRRHHYKAIPATWSFWHTVLYLYHRMIGYDIDTSFASDWSLQRAYCIKGKFTSIGVYKGIVLACASDRALSC